VKSCALPVSSSTMTAALVCGEQSKVN
jgi:hypothetical protein